VRPETGDELVLSMIKYAMNGDTLTFNVRVVPRASRSEIVGEHDGALRVRISAPPVDGAANEELIRVLARAFGVSRGAVEIAVGHSSKSKQVIIRNGVASILADLSYGPEPR
jgi:uncharacterized protein